MNRRELFLQPVTLVWRNKTLWPIALIGLAISAIFNVLFFYTTLIVAGLLLFVSFVLAAFTSGALISMVNTIAAGEPVSVGDGVRAGLRRLMPLLAVNVVLMLPVWIVSIVLSIVVTGSVDLSLVIQLGRPETLQATNMSNLISWMFSLGSVIVIVNVIAAAIGVGAERAIVLEDMPPAAALRRGVQLLRPNISDYLTLGAVLFGVGLALSLLLVEVILQGLGAIFVPPDVQAKGGVAVLTTFLLGPGNVIFIVINLVINSLTMAYASGAWTLAYRYWRSEEEQRDE